MTLTEKEMLAWYIAVGEAKGGKYDMDRRRWASPIQPDTVYAVLSEMS